MALASWHGFFTWYGWEAAVAIGTILLALATGGLAWLTRGLAREAGNETRANWRPVLVVEPAYNESAFLSSPAVQLTPEGLTIGFTNVGRGPALAVRAFLQCEPWSKGSFGGITHIETAAPGDRVHATWAEFHAPRDGVASPYALGRHSGEILCKDVSGATYETEFVLEFSEQGDLHIATLASQRVVPAPSFGPTWSQKHAVLLRQPVFWLRRSIFRIRHRRGRSSRTSI